MTNTSLQSREASSLTPERKALARIGKSFYILCLLLKIALIASSFLLVAYLSDDLFFVVLTILGLYFLAVFLPFFLFMCVCVWATPLSIVPGRSVARCFVISSIAALVCFPVGEFLSNPQRCNICLCFGIYFFSAAFLLFLIYMWRLASAVGSKRVKRHVKWIIIGYLIVIMFLQILYGRYFETDLSQRFPLILCAPLFYLVDYFFFGIFLIYYCIACVTPVEDLLPTVFTVAVLGFIAALSIVRFFGDMAKDIKTFVESHLP